MNGGDVTNYANLVSIEGTEHVQTPGDVVVENSAIQAFLHKTKGTAFIALVGGFYNMTRKFTLFSRWECSLIALWYKPLQFIKYFCSHAIGLNA